MRWSPKNATVIPPLNLWASIVGDWFVTSVLLFLFGLPWQMAILAGALLTFKQELALSYLTNTLKKLPPWVQK